MEAYRKSNDRMSKTGKMQNPKDVENNEADKYGEVTKK